MIDHLIKYGRPFWAGIGEDNAANVAGATQALVDRLFGPKQDAQTSFEQGRRDFKRGLHATRYESPYGATTAETLGTAAFGWLGGLGARGGARTLMEIFRRYGSAAGARALSEALERGTFERNIPTGRMSRQRMDALNRIRNEQGFEPFQENTVMWAPGGQKHLFIRRILGDGRSPQEVANWQREAFFGRNSKPYPNPKYPGISELRAPSGGKIIRGFLTKDKNGRTIGTSVFIERGKRYRIEP